ncbi:MAG: hypothetical protein LBQ97_06100 [Fusobacteriaceae bacterium]|jgi:hypothetical protein|nr:hypothetical protein [Fusobacteriaceae bacterium]
MITQFNHPDFVRKKVKFSIGYLRVQCLQNDIPVKLARGMGFPVIDDKGKQRFLKYTDVIFGPPTVKLDGEKFPLFRNIPPLTYTFALTEALIFFKYPLVLSLKLLIELISFVYLRNMYLRDDISGKRKLVYAVACVLVSGVAMVLLAALLSWRYRAGAAAS